ncbi:right-handed parallel beta-helix repeat-containing protein [Jeotgalibacillus marinus]|uniref:Right-handed parallel beta-helix repeat-containing protein n=1 Tax=Jeotgalibacillus marinus TaxID=86667 RepID=A0ABV3Q7D3_9BACL
MKTSKNKCLVPAILLTFVGVLLIGVVIVAGILFFNEKVLMVPSVEFPEIQDAVDAAVEGDIILVKPKEDGTPYEENVEINTDNIKLIGVGKEKPVIDGETQGPDGITLIDISGVVVKNFIVRDFSNLGILLENSNGNMFKGNNVNNNAAGILVEGSNGNMFKKNTVNDHDVEGISLENSSDNMFKGNNVNDNLDGILLESSNDNMFKKNTSFHNAQAGIFLSNSSGNMFKGNTSNDNDEDGISLAGSDGNFFKGNIANDNGFDNDFNGFHVADSDGNMFTGNNANNNDFDGILLEDDTNDNDVFGNRAFGNGNLDIEDLNVTSPLNNFKGNKCGLSVPGEICD